MNHDHDHHLLHHDHYYHHHHHHHHLHHDHDQAGDAVTDELCVTLNGRLRPHNYPCPHSLVIIIINHFDHGHGFDHVEDNFEGQIMMYHDIS